MQHIAERKLLYSMSGDQRQRDLTICIGAPYRVNESMVDFTVGPEGVWGSDIKLMGLAETYPTTYGADSLQALTLAINAIEPLLKRLSKKYKFYFTTGEPYFDN